LLLLLREQPHRQRGQHEHQQDHSITDDVAQAGNVLEQRRDEEEAAQNEKPGHHHVADRRGEERPELAFRDRKDGSHRAVSCSWRAAGPPARAGWVARARPAAGSASAAPSGWSGDGASEASSDACPLLADGDSTASGAAALARPDRRAGRTEPVSARWPVI